MQAATALYLRLSTKTGQSYEIRESSYKQLKQLFHGHCIVSQSLLTSKGLSFFLKRLSHVFQKWVWSFIKNGAKHSYISRNIRSHLETMSINFITSAILKSHNQIPEG